MVRSFALGLSHKGKRAARAPIAALGQAQLICGYPNLCAGAAA